MAFCGQCGLLLHPNTARCPRCGAIADSDVPASGTPPGQNDATIVSPGNSNTQLQDPLSTPLPQTNSPMQRGGNYPPDGAAYPPPGNYSARPISSPGVPNNGNYPSYNTPVFPSQENGVPPGFSQPGVYPSTNPGYPSQSPIPPRKRSRWPFILLLLLVLLIGAGSAAFLILGPAHLFAFAGNPVATATVAPTVQPSPTTQAQNTPTTQPTVAPTTQATPSPVPQSTQPAQAAIQQYYNDINNKDYQNAYNLWVKNPDTYDHYKQGFAHTKRDDITLGDATFQNDGSTQVNLTIQSTEDAASGKGTQVTTYQGYYIVAQQADGSWKIVTANINRA